MACNITDGIALDCMEGVGGIATVWILGGALGTTTVSSADTISAIGGTGTFFKFELPKDTASFVETINVAPANGTVYYDQALTIQFHKMDTAKRNQIKLLAKNRDLKIVFEDNMGQQWFVGRERGAQMTAGTANTGTAIGDANNYSITLTAQEVEPAYELAGALSSITTGIIVE